MLAREIIPVCCESHTQYTDAQCGKTYSFLKLRVRIMYTYLTLDFKMVKFIGVIHKIKE